MWQQCLYHMAFSDDEVLHSTQTYPMCSLPLRGDNQEKQWSGFGKRGAALAQKHVPYCTTGAV